MLDKKSFLKIVCPCVFFLISVTLTEAQWTSIGPEGGCIISFAFHPTNPDVVYAGCDDSGGMYKSTDGGNSWTLITSAMPDLTAWCIVMDLQNPDILYAGDLYARYGVTKTTDGGTTWTEVNASLGNLHIGSLAINPDNSDVIYAGTGTWQFSGDGVYKSVNGANSWFQSGLSGMRIHCLAIDNQYPDTLYAGTGENGVYKSIDVGTNWIKTVLDGSGILGIAINPDSTNIVYASVLGDTCGVYKSIDGAQTWNLTGLSSTIPWNVAINPSNTEILYATTINEGVYKSINGGVSWNQINSGLISLFCIGLGISPTVPTTIYIGSVIEGIYKSINGGTNWIEVNNGLKNTYVRALAIDPNFPNIIYAGLDAGYQQDIQYTVQRTTNNGINWETCGDFRIDVFSLAVDPVESNILYAGTYLEGLYRSTDSGDSWSSTTGWSDSAVVFSIVFHPQSPDTQYAGAWTPSDPWGVYRSTDRGMTWQPLGLAGSAVAPLAIDPSNPYVLYAGTIYPDSGVYKSTDSGNNWFQTGLDSGSVWSFAMDPLSSNILYAGFREGKLYKSTNGGGDWLQIDPGWTNTDVLSLAINPVDPDVLYAGTSGAEKETAATGGIYQSTDGGNSWTEISSGLTTTHALCLTIHPAVPDTIYTGTYGGGVYHLSGTGIEEDKASPMFPQKLYLFQNCPNPFTQSTVISYQVSAKSEVSLKIYDVTGRMVKRLVNGEKEAGRHNVRFSTKGLTAGLYFCRLKAGNSTTMNKLIILR